ncbi:MAG: NlpC/P60 family protein [Candidatus Sulfotelmatobacter sp.]
MRIRRSRFLPIILFALLVYAAPAKNAVQVVVVPVANMYSGPSDKTDVVSQAIYGSDVMLLVARGEWSRIQTSDHYKGWVPSRHVRTVLTGNGYATAGPTVEVESLFANIYSEPDITKHKPVITVPFETKLEIAPEAAAAAPRSAGVSKSAPKSSPKKTTAKPQDTEGWTHVRLPGQTLAWIQSSDVVADPKPLTIPESIELGKRFVGLPYLWGGRSSFGFDCSGFTQMLVRARGVTMPRDADQQAAWTGVAPVERKNLQAGDLLFFGSSAKKITHTAMYIGDGQFIQAATNGHPVVQISKLNDDPWTRLLVACRRVK